MANVFDQVGDASVFLDEDVLKPEYLPDLLPGREKQVREMAEALKPFVRGRKARPLLLHGPPGVGKTSSAKFVLNQLEDYSARVQGAYVNCWHHSTKQSVLAEACRLLGSPVPRRGLASDEVQTELFSVLAKKKIGMVLVLDEADRLFHRKEESLFYDLLRAEVPVALVGLTNEPRVFGSLDARAKSSFNALFLEFPRYSPIELKEILRKRSEKAFRKQACPEEAIALCAAFASKHGGDARVAIEALWLSGRNAEKRGARTVSEGDCRAAFASQEKLHASQAKRLDGLSGQEQKILDLLGEPKFSSELFGELGLPERTGRRYIESLVLKKIVAFEDVDSPEGRRRKLRKLV
ncbi:AAA family ATPase [Candidatus Micrarchaeota archaeon]|nr:AAA family ATPase [Candidatus Micrarchaeota archaeon]